MKKAIFTSVLLIILLSASAQVSQHAKGTPRWVKDYEMSIELIKYGYQTKNAMPLIMAIQIWQSLSVTESDSTLVRAYQDSSSSLAGTEPKRSIVNFSREQILKDIELYADGNQSLLALKKEALSATRGSLGPRLSRTDIVQSHSTDVWKIRVRGGVQTYVVVSGDGDTDLDVKIYDENGKIVADSENGCESDVLSFVPRWTAVYTIKIKNLGSVYNRYVLTMNY